MHRPFVGDSVTILCVQHTYQNLICTELQVTILNPNGCSLKEQEFTEFSGFTVSDKLLKHELESI